VSCPASLPATFLGEPVLASPGPPGSFDTKPASVPRPATRLPCHGNHPMSVRITKREVSPEPESSCTSRCSCLTPIKSLDIKSPTSIASQGHPWRIAGRIDSVARDPFSRAASRGDRSASARWHPTRKSAYLLVLRYNLAALEGDKEEMARVVALAKGKHGAEHWVAHAEALAMARSGRLQNARSLSSRAVDLALPAATQSFHYPRNCPVPLKYVTISVQDRTPLPMRPNEEGSR